MRRDKYGKMARKKLRNCSRCEVRHGPPIGVRCRRNTREFEDLNEEMSGGRAGGDFEEAVSESATDAWAGEPKSGAMAGQNSSLGLPPVSGEPQEKDESQWPSFSEFRRRREEERQGDRAGGPRSASPTQPPPGFEEKKKKPAEKPRGQEAPDRLAQSQGIYCQVPWDQYPQHLRDQHQFQPTFRVGTQPTQKDFQAAARDAASVGNMDYHMDYRMSWMEKSLGDLMDSQKVLLQYHAEAVAKSQVSAPTQDNTRSATTRREESSESESEQETEGWKDSFGDELWKNVKGRREKNPFDQSSYLKKGETIDSFERVMVVTYKTIAQLLEANGDVKGVVRHGLAMAEKAAKGVYKIEAFTKYDDSVRERAGAVGPSAFGTVDQEDTLRFFSFDNVERTKGWKTSQGSSGVAKKKSDKMCLKYNDQGCNAKSCFYSHRCAACEEVGHPRKECKNLKRKEK